MSYITIHTTIERNIAQQSLKQAKANIKTQQTTNQLLFFHPFFNLSVGFPAPFSKNHPLLSDYIEKIMLKLLMKMKGELLYNKSGKLERDGVTNDQAKQSAYRYSECRKLGRNASNGTRIA